RPAVCACRWCRCRSSMARTRGRARAARLRCSASRPIRSWRRGAAGWSAARRRPGRRSGCGRTWRSPKRWGSRGCRPSCGARRTALRAASMACPTVSTPWSPRSAAEVMRIVREGRPERDEPPRRPGAFRRLIGGVGWLLSGPVDWAGARSIGRGAAAIRGFAEVARSSEPSDGRFRTTEGRFDPRAAAFLQGATVAHFEARLAARRRQTVLAAYAALLIGGGFTLILLRTLLSVPWTLLRLLPVVWFVPFCLLFFLVGFYQAMLNFQLRTGRLATWREYLTSGEQLWPR